MFEKDSSISKGFGYLNFHEKEEAQRCLNEMNNTILDGKSIVLN
jgi:RNA recognition motif-containing protein